MHALTIDDEYLANVEAVARNTDGYFHHGREYALELVAEVRRLRDRNDVAEALARDLAAGVKSWSAEAGRLRTLCALHEGGTVTPPDDPERVYDREHGCPCRTCVAAADPCPCALCVAARTPVETLDILHGADGYDDLRSALEELERLGGVSVRVTRATGAAEADVPLPVVIHRSGKDKAREFGRVASLALVTDVLARRRAAAAP